MKLYRSSLASFLELLLPVNLGFCWLTQDSFIFCWVCFLKFKASQIECFGSINLKSMQTENACNVIPPASRSSNYVAFRYSDFPPEITVI